MPSYPKWQVGKDQRWVFVEDIRKCKGPGRGSKQKRGWRMVYGGGAFRTSRGAYDGWAEPIWGHRKVWYGFM